MQTKHQAAANPQTKSTDSPVGCHHVHPLSPFNIIMQPKGILPSHRW